MQRQIVGYGHQRRQKTSCYFAHQKKRENKNLFSTNSSDKVACSIYKGTWYSVISTVSISFGCKLVFKSFSHPIFLVPNIKRKKKKWNRKPEMQQYTESQSAKSPCYIVYFHEHRDEAKWNKYEIGNTQVMACKHIHYLGHWERERHKKQGLLNERRERVGTRKRDSEKIKANPKLKQSCGSIKCDKETHAEVVVRQQRNNRKEHNLQRKLDLIYLQERTHTTQ